MRIFKLSVIATTTMQIMGPMPLDMCREIEYDVERLIFNIQHALFNQAEVAASFTKGLEVSPYFVNFNLGYWGTYLH